MAGNPDLPTGRRERPLRVELALPGGEIAATLFEAPLLSTTPPAQKWPGRRPPRS